MDSAEPASQTNHNAKHVPSAPVYEHNPSFYEYNNGQQQPNQVFVPQPTTLCKIEVRSALLAINVFTLIMAMYSFFANLWQSNGTFTINFGFFGSAIIIALTLYALYKNGFRSLLIVLTVIKALGLVFFGAFIIFFSVFAARVLQDPEHYNREPNESTVGTQPRLGTDVFVVWIVLAVLQFLVSVGEIYLMCIYIKYLRLRDEASRVWIAQVGTPVTV